MTYEVILRIPDCDGSTPAEAVKDFIAQASQAHLWVYRAIEESGDRRKFIVDMAENPPSVLMEVSS